MSTISAPCYNLEKVYQPQSLPWKRTVLFVKLIPLITREHDAKPTHRTSVVHSSWSCDFVARHPHEEHPCDFHRVRHVHRVCALYRFECLERNSIWPTAHLGRRRLVGSGVNDRVNSLTFCLHAELRGLLLHLGQAEAEVHSTDALQETRRFS